MKVIFTLIFVLTISLGYSQKQEISIVAGYGSSNDNWGWRPFILSPFAEYSESRSFTLSANYHYTFGKKNISRFNTGLSYHNKYSVNLHQFIVPVGINLDHGKRFHFFYGAGLYGKFLIHTPTISNRDYNRAQLGLYYALGFGFRVNDRFDIRLGYHMNLDLTRFYEITLYSPGGAEYEVTVKEYEGLIKVGVAYTLKGVQ